MSGPRFVHAAAEGVRTEPSWAFFGDCQRAVLWIGAPCDRVKGTTLGEW